MVEILKKFFNKNINFSLFYKANFKAFTLAEVLITLGIIGVVAAMTIPTLMQNAQNQGMVEGLLKFNTNLQQAVDLWKNDIGCHDSAGECLAVQNLPDGNGNNFYQIAKFMRVVKNTKSTGCNVDWLPKNTLNYYGNTESSNYGQVANPVCGNVAFLLQDGTTFSMDIDPAGFDITVDVNGKRPPNRIGKDTFKIRVGNNSTNAIFCSPKDICYNYSYNQTIDNGTGLCGQQQSGNCNPNNTDPTKDNGAMPTSYVILNHKLPDFKELAKTVPGFKQ